jgi:hypothetical protein
MNTLSFEPLIPPSLWVLLTLSGLALMVWYGWQRQRPITRSRWAVVLALTGIDLLAVLLILLNPTWIEPVNAQGGKPVLTIVVDATSSMAAPDGHHGLNRYKSAVEAVRVLGEKLGGHFEIRIATCAETIKATDLHALESEEPSASVTNLASAVLGAVEQDKPQGQAVVLFSDGIHNAGGGSGRVIEAARIAKAMACPVYTHTLGGDADVKDLAIDLRAPQEIGFIGQKVAVPVLIHQQGFAGAETNLILSADGKEVDRRKVKFTERSTTEVRFEVGQAKPGVYRYEVTVEPLAEEVTRANNTALFVLRVVDHPVRVLLLEGRPYWDNKFLVRTLLVDPSIELDSVVRVGENRLVHRTLTRTVVDTDKVQSPDQEKWNIMTDLSGMMAESSSLQAYQIVVLGRDTDGLLTEDVLGKLQNWLAREGGCLVCYRGQPMSQVNQRLGKMLPIRWSPMAESRFGVRLTDRGKVLRLIPSTGGIPMGESFQQLPTLASASRPEQPKPLAVVLATGGPKDGEGEPVVTYQPYGTGH